MNYEELCDIIGGILPQPKDINENSSLCGDLGLCSFDLMLLVVKIEDKLNTQITVSSLNRDMTVKELFSVIKDFK